MALKHALLALLAYNSSSGYSLHKMFFELNRPTLSQVYKLLNEMYANNLVDFDVEFGGGGARKLPARKIFYVTDLGHRELQQWINDAGDVVPMGPPFLRKVWFGGLGKLESVAATIKLFKQSREKELEFYDSKAREIGEKHLKVGGNPQDKLCWELVLDYVAIRGKAELKWAEMAMSKIASFDPHDTKLSSIKIRKRARAKRKAGK